MIFLVQKLSFWDGAEGITVNLFYSKYFTVKSKKMRISTTSDPPPLLGFTQD